MHGKENPPAWAPQVIAFPARWTPWGASHLIPGRSPEAFFRGACDQELDEIRPVRVAEIADFVVAFHGGDHVAKIVPVLFVRQLRAEAAHKKSKEWQVVV